MAEKVGGRPRAASVRALDRAVDGLVGEVSASRARQLRMVVGMWAVALERWPAGSRRPSVSPRTMFSEPVLRTFWEMAVAGELRTRGEARGALAVPSQRVVRDCLGLLGDAVVPGQEVWLPVVHQQDPKATVSPAQLRVLYRALVDMAADAPVEYNGASLSLQDRVRLLAMLSVVLDTGARSGELESMRLDDLAEGEAAVLVRRVPQNGDHLAFDEVCALQDGTRVALRRWLSVRRGLVAEMEGTQAALWVSLRPNQWQEKAGFALRAQGIQKAYTRGAAALNGVMAGRAEWEPLPTTLERVRRAVPEIAVVGQ
jgi:integrase